MKNVLLLLFILFIPFQLFAAEDTHSADRKELKNILYSIESSINKNDMGALMSHLDEHALLTFMTTEVAVGKNEVMAYYAKMFTGPDAPLKSHHTKVSDVKPAIFHGNTMVAYGRTLDTFELADGSKRQFNTRWTATAMKNNGAWKVISINFSVNPLNNTIINSAGEMVKQYSVGAFLAGMFVTWLLIRVFSSKRES